MFRWIAEREVAKCLAELAREYLRIAQEHSEDAEHSDQLAAFTLAGIRSISLLNSFCKLVNAHLLDGSIPIGRACLEAVYLQIEFRLKSSEEKACRWLRGEAGTWRTDFKKWKDVAQLRGPKSFGYQYGTASERSHPTFVACQNSGANLVHSLSLPNLQEDGFLNAVGESIDITRKLVAYVTLATFLEDELLIDLPIDKLRLARSLKFHQKYQIALEDKGSA